MKKMPYYSSSKKAIPVAEEPPYLTVGTDVSAKYKGAFCEAKIADVDRLVKLRVLFKGSNSAYLIDDADLKSGYPIKNGTQVEARHPDKGQAYIQATITKITDYSRYTVIFDDGDQCVLRRNSLCLKSGKHFAESETLDQLPLTNPEHFGNPVKVGGASSLARVAQSYYASNSSSNSSNNNSNSNSTTTQVPATSTNTNLPFNNSNPTAAGLTSNDVSKLSNNLVVDTAGEDSESSTTNNSDDADENNDFSNNTSSKSSLIAQDTGNTVSLNESHATSSPNNLTTNPDGNKRRGPKGRKRRESVKEITKQKSAEDTDDDGSSNMSDQTGDSESKSNIKYDTIEIGVRLRVKYGKGKQLKVYEAKVNKMDNAIPGKPRYYVHYTGWNNRYDEWITRGRIVSIVREDSPKRRKGNVGNKGIPLDALANDEQELKKPSPSSPAVKTTPTVENYPPTSEATSPKRQSRPATKGSSKPSTNDALLQPQQPQQLQLPQQPLEDPPNSITKEKNKEQPQVVSQSDSSSSKSFTVTASSDPASTPISKADSTNSETNDSDAKTDSRESFSISRGRRKGRQALSAPSLTRRSSRINVSLKTKVKKKSSDESLEPTEAPSDALPVDVEPTDDVEPSEDIEADQQVDGEPKKKKKVSKKTRKSSAALDLAPSEQEEPLEPTFESTTVDLEPKQDSFEDIEVDIETRKKKKAPKKTDESLEPTEAPSDALPVDVEPSEDVALSEDVEVDQQVDGEPRKKMKVSKKTRKSSAALDLAPSEQCAPTYVEPAEATEIDQQIDEARFKLPSKKMLVDEYLDEAVSAVVVTVEQEEQSPKVSEDMSVDVSLKTKDKKKAPKKSDESLESTEAPSDALPVDVEPSEDVALSEDVSLSEDVEVDQQVDGEPRKKMKVSKKTRKSSAALDLAPSEQEEPLEPARIEPNNETNNDVLKAETSAAQPSSSRRILVWEAEEIDEFDCDKKISILLKRLHALRQTYISIKAEVAQIDRRRKKAKNRRDRKELRTRSATAAAAAAEVNRFMTGINSPSACDGQSKNDYEDPVRAGD